MEKRIIIHGLGTVNQIGLSVPETRENAIHGDSEIGRITLFDATDFPVQCACEVKGFNPENHIPAKNVRRRDRFQRVASFERVEALSHHGDNFWNTPRDEQFI